jgi:hypothetical protein
MRKSPARSSHRLSRSRSPVTMAGAAYRQPLQFQDLDWSQRRDRGVSQVCPGRGRKSLGCGQPRRAKLHRAVRSTQWPEGDKPATTLGEPNWRSHTSSTRPFSRHVPTNC